MNATATPVDFSAWEFEDIYDTQLPPGVFVSPTRTDIEVIVGSRRVTVPQALNWHHAQHRAYKMLLEERGQDLNHCELCGNQIRYAVLYMTPDDALHVTGKDCAERVNLNVGNEEDWAIAQAVAAGKEINTARGKRWKTDFYCPDQMRYVSRDALPKDVSVWTPKARAGRGFAQPKPRVTVWASSQVELAENVRNLRKWLTELNIAKGSLIKRRA